MNKTYIILIALLLTTSVFAQNQKGTFTDERDGIEYGTIKIGEQVWMSSNLSFQNATFRGWQLDWFDENNQEILLQQYGLLYHYRTVYKNNKNICPCEWHLPSMDEWEVLFTSLGGEEKAVNQLKSDHNWNTTNGNNESGFNAFPGGDLNSDGMDFSRSKTVFWSSSSIKGTFNENGYPNYGHYAVLISGGLSSFATETSSYSIRCLKNNSTRDQFNDSLNSGDSFYKKPCHTKDSSHYGLSIGDTTQGGIVFYLDSSGRHGLVAKATDEGKKNWKQAVKDCKNLTSGGHTDWYLPSEDELHTMYLRRHKIGGFAKDYYWNSREISEDGAMVQHFYLERHIVSQKDSKENVRAIRSF
jgi:uncharacterized protein (TIGR02145 family)